MPSDLSSVARQLYEALKEAEWMGIDYRCPDCGGMRVRDWHETYCDVARALAAYEALKK